MSQRLTPPKVGAFAQNIARYTIWRPAYAPTSTTKKMNPLVRDLYKRCILVGREYPAGSLHGYVIFTRVAEQHLAYGGGKRGGEPPSYQDVWSD